MIVLEVAVCAPVRQTYTYASPHDSDAASGTELESLAGKRVVVPFGKQRVVGYVLEQKADAGENRDFEIKPVREILDTEPLFPVELIPLFRWVAEYYHYPIGLVVKSALPSGLSASPRKIIALQNRGTGNPLAEIPDSISHKPWFAKLAEEGVLQGRTAQRLLSARKEKKDLAYLQDRGIISINTEIKRDRVSRKIETCYRLSDTVVSQIESGREDWIHAADEESSRPRSQAALKSVRLLHSLGRDRENGNVPRKEFTGRYPYGAKVISGLVADGLVVEEKRRIYRNPFGDLLPFYPRPEALSDEQQTALDCIGSALDESRYQPFLLHGVTGSGKTEVYLRAAEQALANRKTVLVLVPEIALATQVEAHFISRFQDKVALLHSGLSPGERFDEWWRILNGSATIVIGARSAVFAPLKHIGLIVVDEEHDSSFKQEDRLRYNGRDLALVRGKQRSCTVILGSATPSVTSYYHSKSDKYRLLEMRRRLGDRELPEAAVVDLKEQKGKKRTALPILHHELEQALRRNLENRRQSIMLLNRRGFSTSVICRGCGSFVECGHCKVTMNLHKQRNILLCHYCGSQSTTTAPCSTCGSDDLHPVGFGTERVEAELKVLFPEAVIGRLDSDIAADRKRFLAILKSMQDGDIDILIGTQIIAKGLHFPGVTLVGILMADSGLGFPDYRAAEKTYQLITQVTGRAGRGDAPGKVIIQTMQPDHYAVALAAEQRYADLVKIELTNRSGIGFPPYSRLVLIIIEDSSSQQAKQTGIEICTGIQQWRRKFDLDSAITVLGPAPAPLEKLRDNYRWQILLKSEKLPRLHGLTDWVLSGYKSRPGTVLHIDIDPENMM